MGSSARDVEIVRVGGICDFHRDDDGHGGIGGHTEGVRVFKIGNDGRTTFDRFGGARPVAEGGHGTCAEFETRLDGIEARVCKLNAATGRHGIFCGSISRRPERTGSGGSCEIEKL